MDTVKHLGNYIDTANNDAITDFTHKKILTMLIRLACNYNHLQPNILMNLVKTLCCSAYGSHLWKFNSKGFDNYCKTWNVAVLKLVKLP